MQPSPPNVPNTFDRLLAYDLEIGAHTGACLIAGADEVGVACLAGPLVAAACLFDWKALTPAELDQLARLNDSKKLTPARCQELRTVITELAVCVAVCVVTPAEIDLDGLHDSNLRALLATVSQMEPAPDVCFTDGAAAIPDSRYDTTALVRGDETSAAVAAASVIAKATRDDLMDEVIAKYPKYGFERHQGYITKEHNDAIRQFGITRHHRLSYKCAIYRELGIGPFAKLRTELAA
jgi:ribonuclease HII